MERAGSIPLHTHVLCTVQNTGATEAFWRDILPHVAQAIGRSRAVHINFILLPQTLSIFSTPSPLPKLRYLWLEWRASLLEEGFLDLSQATSLSLLSISSSQYDIQQRLRLRLPEECQIQWLRLGQVAFPDAMEAVTRCASRLESLYLEHSVDEMNGLSTSNPPELYFARLRQLHLRGPTASTIFHTIVAPELQSLEIECHNYDGPIRYPRALPDTQQFPRLRKLFLPC